MLVYNLSSRLVCRMLCGLLPALSALPLCHKKKQPAELPPLRLPAAKRLVAIGDLHGDLEKV